MNRLAVLFFALVALAAFGASVSQAQTPPPPTEPQVVTNYNSFHITLGVPTTSPYIAVPATGTPVCAAAMNLPFANTYFTPQGSDDSYVWHPLTGIGNGSIITPGVYVGVNPYRFFRLYFTQSSYPGASGYVACGDNATSLLAPMLNGENGVLNTYQELIAIGHAGCATFDVNGFLLPTGSACSGGGGSTCANPPSPAPSPSPLGCVVLQDTPSPTPQLYNDGQGSAAVGGILQGGSLYTFDGSLNSQNSTMTFCADETGGFCNQQGFAGFSLTNDAEGMDLQQTGFSAAFNESGNTANFTATAGGVGFGSSGGGQVLLEGFTAANNVGTQLSMSTRSSTSTAFFGATHMDIEGMQSSISTTPAPGSVVVLGNVTPEVDVGCCFTPADSKVLIGGTASNTPPRTHIILDGTLEESSVGPGPYPFGSAPWGFCTMSASTTCANGGATSLTNAICIATVQGATPIAGSCALSGGTITITAATSNSDVWAYIILGVPH